MDTPVEKPAKPQESAQKPAAPATPGASDRAAPVPIDIMPDHPFTRMKVMILDSADKLPLPLLIIILTALLMTVGTGIAMKMATPSAKNAFLPLRIEVDETKPAIDAARIQGYWTATGGDKTMSLRLDKTGFELIIKPPGKNYNRRFSRGSYRVEGNVLILSPRGDLGKPSLNSEGLVFNPIALSNININVEENGKLMVWLIPKSERAYQDRDVLSLFPETPEKPMTWVKMSGPSAP